MSTIGSVRPKVDEIVVEGFIRPSEQATESEEEREEEDGRVVTAEARRACAVVEW